jgi:hypothetical protein
MMTSFHTMEYLKWKFNAYEHVCVRVTIQVRVYVRTCDVVLMIAEYTSLLVVLLISASAMSLVIVWGRKKLSSGDSPST